jgi:outer membrane protein TolC
MATVALGHLVATSLAYSAVGQDPVWPPADTLRLTDVIAAARETNPMLQAVRLRADAAQERVPQAGALPDPQLLFGFMNRPVKDLARTDQPMTMNSVSLMQRLPWPGKLGFSEDRAEYLAAAEVLEAQEVERRLLARVKSVYYRLAFMDRALIIMGETRELLRDFLQVSSARYAVGSGLQQDVLQAQVSVAQMTEDITVMEQDRVAMAARLNALLGRGATAPVELMDLAAAQRPALQAARQRALAAEAGYKAARRALYPDITISLGYGGRPQFDDFVTLMFGINIPVFAGSRQLPKRREMQAMQRMEEARERDLYNETFAQLAELRAQANRAQNLSDLYQTSVLPQARAAVESAMSAYRVGRVDYTTLVMNEMTVNRYQIESVRLAAEYHQAVAQVEALVGATLGGER